VDSLGKVGKYELLKKLALGGMAEIFLARQTGVQGFEKIVVIKRILPHLAAQERFVQMFLNEARLAARFTHPNIVQIYDLGQDDQAYFLAMEYVHGEDIKSIVRRCASLGRRIPIEHVLRLATGVLEALHYAHTQPDADGKPGGVVHRDVSPHNILLSFQGNVKLVDFGIAKARSQISTTIPGRVKGKHAYMSPEQCQGLDLDGRSDIFSLGIVMFELLTWTRLFKRKHDLETLKAISAGEIPSPRSIRPDLDPALEAILLKALSPDRNLRYQNAQEMQVAIEDFMVSRSLLSSSVLLSRFLQDLFAEKLAVQKKALTEARAANLENVVLQAQAQGQGPDLVAFLDSFFGEGTRGTESSSVSPSADPHPEFTPSGDFTPLPDPAIHPGVPIRPQIPIPARRNGAPPKPPPPRAPEGESVRHVAPGRRSAPPPLPSVDDLLSAGSAPSAPPAAGMDVPGEAEPADPDSFLREQADPFAPKPRKPAGGLPMLIGLGALVVIGVIVLLMMGKGASNPPPRGKILVESYPPGAAVYLDDVMQEQKTPAEIEVKPGEEHVLRIEADNYPTWEQKFTLTDIATPLKFTAVFDQNAAARIKLSGSPIVAGAEGQGKGAVRIESAPPGALVYLDGISTDKRTPVTLKNLPAGLDHVVQLELEGRDPAARRFHLDPGQEARFSLELPEAGPQDTDRTSVRFETEPEGAKVIVNEWPIPKPTPVPVKLLNASPSEVKIEKAGFRDWSALVRPVPGVDLTILVRLKKK